MPRSGHLRGGVGRPGPTHALESRRNRWLLAGLGLALLVATGIAAAVVSRGGGTDPVVVPPNSVAAIDPASNEVVEAIPVDEGPGPVAAGTDGLWVLNRTSRTLSRIDPRARRLLDTAGLGAFVDNLAVAGREVWVADCTLTDSLVRLDPRTKAPAWYGAVRLDLPSSGVKGGRIISFPGCGLAAEGRSAWATNNLLPGLMRVDLGPPDADGTARAETALVVELAPVPTAPGVPAVPPAIAVGLGSVWIAVSSGDLVRQVDPEIGDVLRVISVGRSPAALAAGADAVWVANRGDDSVSRIDPRTSSVRQVISVGDQPVGLAVGEGAVWVANSGDGTVSRIDPATNSVVETIQVGYRPQGVALAAGLVWVTVRS
jgi:YVTN family beta-propeller protein